MSNKIQIRRGNFIDLPNPLDNGEPGWCDDSKQLFIGTGVANENVFIGGAAPTQDYRIYLATTALGGTSLSSGATGLLLEAGTATGTTANKLVNGNANFTSALVDHAVYNSTDNTWAKITAVDDANTLSLSADIMIAGEDYEIADAVDSLEDAYSLVPSSYGVNITIVISNGTHQYAGDVTLGGKTAAGAVSLSLLGGAFSTTIASTTTTTLTLGDPIDVSYLIFSDPVVTNGATTFAWSTLVGDLTANAALSLTSTTWVQGVLTANGSLTTDSGSIVFGNATVEGVATLVNGDFNANLTCNGPVTNTTALDVTGNLITNDTANLVDINVGGDLTINGEFDCATDIDVAGDIVTNAKTTVSGTVTCDNITTNGGKFTQTGSLTISTNATFNSEVDLIDVSVGGDLISNAILTIGTDLDVTGDITFNGGATISGTITCVDFISAGDLVQTGSLDVSGNMETFGVTTVLDVSVGGNLTINEPFTQTVDLDVTGSLTTFASCTLNGITIGGDADFGGPLYLTGTSVFNSNVYARDRFEVATATFNKNVYSEFGADGVWDTCTITSPFKLYIQSAATANTIIDSTLTVANNPSGITNINSTINVGYTIYVATPALGGDDATATGLELFSSTATGTTASKLVDSAASFDSTYLNKTVWNVTDDTWAEVTAVDSSTQLSLDANIMATGESYKVVDAFATIQGGVDNIPGAVDCETTIKISNGTFQEAISVQGKAQSGSFNINIVGTMATISSGTLSGTVANYNAGTMAFVTHSAGWTVDEHTNRLFSITGGDGYSSTSEWQNDYVIESNTASVLTLVGSFYATPVSGSTTYKIIEHATIIDGNSTLADGLTITSVKEVVTKYLNVEDNTNAGIIYTGSSGQMFGCITNRYFQFAAGSIMKNIHSSQVDNVTGSSRGFYFLGSETVPNAAAGSYGFTNCYSRCSNPLQIGFGSYLHYNYTHGSKLVNTEATSTWNTIQCVVGSYADLCNYIVTTNVATVANLLDIRENSVVRLRQGNDVYGGGGNGISVDSMSALKIYAAGSKARNNTGWGFSSSDLSLGAGIIAGITYSSNGSGSYTADASSTNT